VIGALTAGEFCGQPHSEEVTVSPAPSPDRVEEALATRAGELGLDLEGVTLTSAGRHRMLRVAVDKDGGVSLDDLAEATRDLSVALDETDLMGEHPYTLEVTSPGVDRPLTLPRHWRRNRDRLVTVTLADDETVTGRIGSSDEHGVVLDVDGTERTYAYADVVKAKIQVEFSRKEG
jgi:ribosome maturation factor RimP